MLRDGINQNQLAQKSGIGKDTVHRILNDQTTANIKTLVKIARTFNMDIRELLAVVEFGKEA